MQGYETAPFRDPHLFGVPVLTVGVGGHITYEGQYISHKVRTIVQMGKNKTVWIIQTGFVTLLAKHKDYDYVFPIMTNGFLTPLIAEVMANKDDYHFLEDIKPVREVHVPYESILNLDAVTQGKSPALLLDPHKLLSKIPRDVLSKYYDLLKANKALQDIVYEQSVKITELQHQVELYASEVASLHNLLDDMMFKNKAMAAALRELKVMMLQSKERQRYLEQALKTTTADKEKWELLSKEAASMAKKFSEMVGELDSILKKVEEFAMRAEETKTKLRLQELQSTGEEAEEGGEESDEVEGE